LKGRCIGLALTCVLLVASASGGLAQSQGSCGCSNGRQAAVALGVTTAYAIQCSRIERQNKEVQRCYAYLQDEGPNTPIAIVFVDPNCLSCRQCVSKLVGLTPIKGTVHIVLVGEEQSIQKAGLLLEAVQEIEGLSPALLRILEAACSLEAIAYYEVNPEALSVNSGEFSLALPIARTRVDQNSELLRKLPMNESDGPVVYLDGRRRHDGCSDRFLDQIR